MKARILFTGLLFSLTVAAYSQAPAPAPRPAPSQRARPVPQPEERVQEPETVYIEKPAQQTPPRRAIQPETVYVDRPVQQNAAPSRRQSAPQQQGQPQQKETLWSDTPQQFQGRQQQQPSQRQGANRNNTYQEYQEPAQTGQRPSSQGRQPQPLRGNVAVQGAGNYNYVDSARSLSYYIPTTDYNKIIIPEDSIAIDFEERLVQTAWKNLPQNRNAEAKVKMAQEYLTQAKRSWFTEIVFFAQSNFTDYGAAGSRPTVSALPSGLGAGLSFNLGQFVNYGSRVRYQKNNVESVQAELNYQKHFMRSETLKRYQGFLMYKNLTRSQTELANEQEMTLKVMKLNFETGQVPVEEFAKIQKAYADAMQLVITSRHNMLSAKAYLEEWIGVKLEEVK